MNCVIINCNIVYQDIIRRMMKVDPVQRASVPELYGHSWILNRRISLPRIDIPLGAGQSTESNLPYTSHIVTTTIVLATVDTNNLDILDSLEKIDADSSHAISEYNTSNGMSQVGGIDSIDENLSSSRKSIATARQTSESPEPKDFKGVDIPSLSTSNKNTDAGLMKTDDVSIIDKQSINHYILLYVCFVLVVCLFRSQSFKKKK